VNLNTGISNAEGIIVKIVERNYNLYFSRWRALYWDLSDSFRIYISGLKKLRILGMLISILFMARIKLSLVCRSYLQEMRAYSLIIQIDTTLSSI
jgi:hypothetical protein